MKHFLPKGAISLISVLIALPSFAAGVLVGSPSGRVSSSSIIDFDHLRLSVIRIQAVSAGFDWSRPFIPSADGVGLGSGFVVQTDPYPLFVTNAHVINDAKHVSLQLLLYGAQQWEAEVVAVCSKFDLAILVLKEPEVFTEALASRNITLRSLEMASGAAAMGEDVVALGFPLGQDALKISKGNIAGNEDVNGNICLQSTAPISPGSSGGPLLDGLAQKVVGVNFAKSTVGENINYVIPAWRVSQMVAKHLHDQPNKPTNCSWQRLQLHLPRTDLITVEANEALYSMSGCKEGVYVSRVGKRSLFRRANPPVESGAFLVSVNGKQLDRFGTGLHKGYVADRVSYADLLFMVQDMSAKVAVETCLNGKMTQHTVDMEWYPVYDQGLRYVDEPNTEGISLEYEMFGDISVMQMTVNHVDAALSKGDPGPARWLHPEFVSQPRLVINYVRSGSYASHVVFAGAAVDKVNGHAVRTLEELRDHFFPKNGSDTWTLETDLGKLAAVNFNESLAQQVSQASAMNAPYLLTPGVVNAAKMMGLKMGFGIETSKPTGKLSHPVALVRQGVAVAGDRPRPEAAGPLLVQRHPQGWGQVTKKVAPAVWQLLAV